MAGLVEAGTHVPLDPAGIPGEGEFGYLAIGRLVEECAGVVAGADDPVDFHLKGFIRALRPTALEELTVAPNHFKGLA